MKYKSHLLFFCVLTIGCTSAYAQLRKSLPNTTDAYIIQLLKTNTDSVTNHSIRAYETRSDSLVLKLHGKTISKVDASQQKLENVESRLEQAIGKVVSNSNSISEKVGSYGLEELPALKTHSLRNLDNVKLVDDQFSSPTNAFGMQKSMQRLTEEVNTKLGELGQAEMPNWIKEDLNAANLKSALNAHKGMLDDPSIIDQLADGRAAQLSEFQELNSQSGKLAMLKELPESMIADLQRFQDQEALKTEVKTKAIEQATNHFAGHEDKISEAQSAFNKLKKKYSYIPDSRDLSTAIKANSLKREPLKKRFVPGLGFQLHRTNPLSLELSPSLLFRFNKLFSAGISGIYRLGLGIENNSAIAQDATADVYGVSAIAQHRFWRGFFAHGEFQYLSTPTSDPVSGSDLNSRQWNEGLPIGIGKQISFSEGLKGQMIFTYDLLHDSNSPNPKAWNLKFGFQFGKMRLKDIQF